MKNFILLLLAIFLIAASQSLYAQVILDPGDARMLTLNSATGGEVGNNGNFTFNMDGSYSLGSKTIKSQTNSRPFVTTGWGEAYSLIYYDFQISSTPETHNNTVAGFIDYNVLWQGYQHLFGIVSSNAHVTVELIIRNRTTNDLVKHEMIHDLDLKTHSYKIITIGLNYDDSGISANTLPVVLRRGHEYRVHLKLTTSLFILGVNQPLAYCDYMDGSPGPGNGRVELTRLMVKVGLDEKETLARLDDLEHRLENHYHGYLTGRGAGHNNTDANTTLTIFDDEATSRMTSPVFLDSQPTTDPGDVIENNMVPEDFSVGHNHPHPFNPSTKISFAVPEQQLVTIRVYDILGRHVETLLNEIKTPGYYEVIFNGERHSSGTYIYQMTAGSFVESGKMILTK